MLLVAHQYLWDVAETIEGCQSETVDIINWIEQSHPVVSCSRMLSSICRHDNDFQIDNVMFISWKTS